MRVQAYLGVVVGTTSATAFNPFEERSEEKVQEQAPNGEGMVRANLEEFVGQAPVGSGKSWPGACAVSDRLRFLSTVGPRIGRHPGHSLPRLTDTISLPCRCHGDREIAAAIEEQGGLERKEATGLYGRIHRSKWDSAGNSAALLVERGTVLLLCTTENLLRSSRRYYRELGVF